MFQKLWTPPPPPLSPETIPELDAELASYPVR
jgi:hypothetical protein